MEKQGTSCIAERSQCSFAEAMHKLKLSQYFDLTKSTTIDCFMHPIDVNKLLYAKNRISPIKNTECTVFFHSCKEIEPGTLVLESGTFEIVTMTVLEESEEAPDED